MSYNGDCPPADFWVSVSAGDIAGSEQFSFFGERPSATNDNDGEDIWPGSATSMPLPPTGGEQMTLVSTSNEDGAGSSTGILEVEIHYIDASGNQQTESKTLSGTTPVNTTATNIRFIQKIHAIDVGSNGVAVGDITIYKLSTPATVYSIIESGGNMSLVCSRMVPAGKSLYITSWSASQGKNQTVSMRLRTTSENGDVFPGVFLFKDTRVLQLASANGFFNPPLKIPALSIVKVSGWPQSSGASLSATVTGILIDD